MQIDQLIVPPLPPEALISHLNFMQFFFHLFWSLGMLILVVLWLPSALNFLYHLVLT